MRGHTEMPVVKWLASLEMDMVTRVQILDEVFWFSHRANILGERYESSYVQIVGQTVFFNLGMATGIGEGKLHSDLLNPA